MTIYTFSEIGNLVHSGGLALVQGKEIKEKIRGGRERKEKEIKGKERNYGK